MTSCVTVKDRKPIGFVFGVNNQNVNIEEDKWGDGFVDTGGKLRRRETMEEATLNRYG